MTFIEQFLAARRGGVPLIGIRTPDPAATIGSIQQNLNGSVNLLMWDIARGVQALSQNSVAALEGLCGEAQPNELTKPTEVLQMAVALGQGPDSVNPNVTQTKFPGKSILFFFHHQEFFKSPSYVQAIWNVRDEFKKNRRTLVLVGADFSLPPALAQDIIMLDEPYPNRVQLEGIIKRTYTAAQLPDPNPEIVDRAVDAVIGLPAFTVEQIAAMSVSSQGIDIDNLRERNRQEIQKCQGLSVYRGTETLDEVKGCDALINYLVQIVGNAALFLFMDELDKMFAGLGNDQDSATKEMTQTFLTWTETKDAKGEPRFIALFLMGPAGTGKSMIAKAVGNKFGKPTVMYDISSMKASLLGESQQNMLRANKTVDAIAGEKRIVLIGTGNRVGAMTPELRRRFNYGTFFIDLPNAPAQDLLWKQYTKRYGLKDYDRPKCEGWTGAEIRNCCMIAKETKQPLKSAGLKIVPVAVQAKEELAALRSIANNRYLSASEEGPYVYKGKETLPVLDFTSSMRSIASGTN